MDTRFYENSGSVSLRDLLAGLDVIVPDGTLGDEIIDSVSDLSQAQPGSITFLQNAKHKTALASSKASACFVTEDLAQSVAKYHILPIISAAPRAHFARIIPRLIQIRADSDGVPANIHKDAFVHETAIVGSGAELKSGVYIGPYSVIGPGVSIGPDSRLESHVSVQCANIGTGCLIKSGARIGTEGFGIASDEAGLVNLPHIGRTIIGHHVRIGANSCIDRGFLGDTVIDDYVKIDNQVQIAHNCHIGYGTCIAAHVGVSGSCKVGKYVVMGGAVGLADHLEIGDGAQIAAAAGVMHNIPAGERWAGTPAMPIREFMRMVSASRKLATKPRGR